jgi:hypothetical protein
LGFKFDWSEISEAGVESGAVVKGFDVAKDGGASLGQGGEVMMVNEFVFEATPKGLNEGIVVAVALRAIEASSPC